MDERTRITEAATALAEANGRRDPDAVDRLHAPDFPLRTPGRASTPPAAVNEDGSAIPPEVLSVTQNNQEIDHGRHGGDHLLDIVEEQQRVSRRKDGNEPPVQGRLADLKQTDRLPNRWENEKGVADRSHRHGDHPVSELAPEIGRDLESETRLADTSRSR